MDWWIGRNYNIIIYAQFLSGEPVSWAVAHLLQLSIPVNCSALPGWPLYQPILAQSRPPPDSLPLSLSLSLTFQAPLMSGLSPILRYSTYTQYSPLLSPQSSTHHAHQTPPLPAWSLKISRPALTSLGHTRLTLTHLLFLSPNWFRMSYIYLPPNCGS